MWGSNARGRLGLRASRFSLRTSYFPSEVPLLTSNFSDATVITLYLFPQLNEKLRPKLLAELKPGTRIVSHQFEMGDWKPERTETIDSRTIYFWTIPAK